MPRPPRLTRAIATCLALLSCACRSRLLDEQPAPPDLLSTTARDAGLTPASVPGHPLTMTTFRFGPTTTEAFFVDTQGRMWRSEDRGAWQQAGFPRPGVRITGGISSPPSWAEAWVIGDDGHLYILWDDNNHWIFDDHGAPPCGAAAGNPASAMNIKGKPDGLVRCADGELAELYLDDAGWHWVSEGFPTSAQWTSKVAGDPSFAASATFTGAAMTDDRGHLLIVQLPPEHGPPMTWPMTWTDVPPPPGERFTGAPCFYSTAGGLVGGMINLTGNLDLWFHLDKTTLGFRPELVATGACTTQGDYSVTWDNFNDITLYAACREGNVLARRLWQESADVWTWRNSYPMTAAPMATQPAAFSVVPAYLMGVAFLATDRTPWEARNTTDPLTWVFTPWPKTP